MPMLSFLQNREHVGGNQMDGSEVGAAASSVEGEGCSNTGVCLPGYGNE